MSHRCTLCSATTPQNSIHSFLIFVLYSSSTSVLTTVVQHVFKRCLRCGLGLIYKGQRSIIFFVQESIFTSSSCFHLLFYKLSKKEGQDALEHDYWYIILEQWPFTRIAMQRLKTSMDKEQRTESVGLYVRLYRLWLTDWLIYWWSARSRHPLCCKSHRFMCHQLSQPLYRDFLFIQTLKMSPLFFFY